MDAQVSGAPPAAAFAARVRACQARIEGVLERALALPDPGTQRLRAATRYSVLGAGKRLWPTLVYLTLAALDPLGEAGAALAQLANFVVSRASCACRPAARVH
jgi:geranylgeranyl pyrophosphate synthase